MKKIFILILLFFSIMAIIYFSQNRTKLYVLEHYNKDLNTSYYFCAENRLCKIVTPKYTISYKIDKNGYRIEKLINNKLVEKNFWLGSERLHMVVDKNNNALREYLYKNEYENLPYGMKSDGKIYHFIYNKMHSLRVILDNNNHIVKVLYYDKNGSVIKDTNSSLKVDFAYAGGIWDGDAKLLFFKEGVYIPGVSKWISKIKKIDIIENLKELNSINKNSVYICNATLDTFYHSYICAENQCGGLYATKYMRYFNATGIIEDNSKYFNKSICKKIKLSEQYNKNIFAKCVYKEITYPKKEPFDALRHNCHDEVKNIVKICKKQSLKENL